MRSIRFEGGKLPKDLLHLARLHAIAQQATPGALVRHTLSFDITTGFSPQRTYTMTLDSTNVVPEAEETNNTFSGPCEEKI